MRSLELGCLADVIVQLLDRASSSAQAREWTSSVSTIVAFTSVAGVAFAGLSRRQIRAGLAVGISSDDMDLALKTLCNEGVIVCTDGTWWRRGKR
jgi:hypothetical protein